MPIPSKVIELVKRFEEHLDAYKSGKYNEAQLRQEFLDPFFGELGWDVENSAGLAEAYKDVIHEDSIRIGGFSKAPDYCFRVGGARKFFLEAKKPSVDLKEDENPAHQLRRYAWSAKLPLSILTDFEEFAVYDCRIRPLKNDKTSVGRIFYCKFTDYAGKWDEIAGIFSKEAVLKGSFDKYAESVKGKKGTSEVDQAFLKEIESWRSELAKNIAICNQKLSNREINFAVQKTIDRVIFLRICEDRGIETYGKLQGLINSSGIYGRLFEIFERADERYNSGIFHFRSEKNVSEAPDDVTPRLKIDDKVLKDILKSLYPPESPYAFSVLPVEILGQVYEQFLGQVIHLTEGHHARIEEKPEVKKAGGVYYTPSYIVSYIVKNTVGKLLEGKTPKQAAKLKILDPACGSGSFLIGAYQYLLDWHRDWYVKDGTEKWTNGKRPVLYEHGKDDWRLTTAEKKQILLNNIYGVDIDSQAVEVTKLSLLLKVLEGESGEVINRQLQLFHERVLPDLGNNIKCGNSLIGPDFYNSQQLDLFSEEERYRINAFDWYKEFPGIMENGGFDVVIGNPPYGFHQIHAEILKPYLKSKYNASQGSFENYFLFYEKSLRLLQNNGRHGFIVPVTWLTIPSARSLRKFILDNYHLTEICWLPELVFSNAQVNTLVSIIQKTKDNNVAVKIYDSLGFIKPPKGERFYKQQNFIAADYFIGIFEDATDGAIIKKLLENSWPLEKVGRPCSGYNPYEVGKGVDPNGGLQTKETVVSKPYHSEKKINNEWKPEVVGKDLRRYAVNFSGKKWIKYGPWLAAPRDPENFKGKRILVQEIVGGKERRIIAAFFDGELFHSRDVIPIKMENKEPNPLYILSVLNSRLLTWFHHKRNPKAQKGLFPKVLVADLKKMPIRSIDLTKPFEKDQHDRLVKLANEMLVLNKKLVGAKTDQEKIVLQRQIDATDQEIDRLVYQLYGLTPDEIKIVEESTKAKPA